MVTPPVNSDESARIMVARLAARLVSELIDEDDIVGLGPGRTIVETCELIVDVPTCDVVQLTGGDLRARSQSARYHAAQQGG